MQSIQLNGSAHPATPGQSLAELIASLDIDLKNVAIEHNRSIIPRSQLSQVTLAPGDEVEVVEFIGGG